MYLYVYMLGLKMAVYIYIRNM